MAAIDLDAVIHNVKILKSRLSIPTEFCAVVKANAYGHGVAEVAPALTEVADVFAVATSQESVQLRGILGREARILVLGPQTAESMLLASEADADIAVSTVDQFLLAVAQSRLLRIHVKVDSGMNRAGLKGLEALRAVVDSSRGNVVGLMTHFATADDMESPVFAQQLERFQQSVGEIAGRSELLIHAANTAATIRSDECHFGMVRCGIGVYGIDPLRGSLGDVGLRCALSLSSYVAQLNPVLHGEGVGYGHTFRSNEHTTLGLVPIGYGDGIHRALSNSGFVSIEGGRYPIVGNVSMDSLVVNLGRDSSVKVGAPVELLGANVSANEMAAAAGTIAYEVLTHLNSRVVREATRMRLPRLA
ncbi:MAG: alanine racemase [bacterium]|nr:alanine racemase [bacterium]